MYGKVYLGADDQKTVDQAEADLLEASNTRAAKKEPTDISHQAIQEKVDLLFEDFEDRDVKVEGVRKGSIIFEFKCQSLTAILDLIDYFYSSNFQRRLDDIAQALEGVTDRTVYITAVGIDTQTIKNVIYNLQKTEYKKVVQFELSCASVDGLLHILEVFEEGKAANSLNELSKALSDSVGKPVTLHTSIDMYQMKKAIQTIKDQLAAEDSRKSSARLTESKNAGSSTKNPHHLPAEMKTNNLQNASLEEKGALNTMTQEQKCEHLSSVKNITSKQKFEDEMAEVLPNQSLSSTLEEPNYIIVWGDQEIEHKMEYARALHKEHHPSDLPESTSTAHNDMPSVYQNEQQNNITKCAYLSPDRLLLANQNNMEVVVVDIKTGSVVNKKKLHGRPFDITVLPEDQAAVTLQYVDKVLIICTADMSTLNKISISGYPSGITYHQGALYVVYQPPFFPFLSVCVLNLKDDHHREVKLDIRSSHLQYLKCYIAVNKRQQSLYITDGKISAVIRYSLYGERTAVYKHKELKHPQGLAMLDDDSLLVCSVTGSIHHISADLQKRLIVTHLSEASSIAYDPDHHLVYISSKNRNRIQAFSLKNIVSYGVQLVFKKDINLKSIDVPGNLAVLSQNRILVVDYIHKTLSDVNINTGSVVAKIVLHNRPFNIAVLPEDQAAVTLPMGDKIIILNTKDMSAIYTISVKSYPSGITYNQDELFVVYHPSFMWYLSVLVLNLKGEHLREVKLDKIYHPYATYLRIVVSNPQQNLYITDEMNNVVTRYSLHGKRTAQYKLQEFENPNGLIMLDDGSLLVCCIEGAIHHISADLNQGCILARVPLLASSIAYDSDNQLIYISSGYSNIIKVYSVKKKPDKLIGQSEKETPGESVSLKAGGSITATEKNHDKLIGQSEKETPGESVSLKAEGSVTATEKKQSKCNIL